MKLSLKPLKREEQKSVDFATIDIETMKWTKFIVLGYYDGKEYKEFRRLADFVKYIKEYNTPHTIFAHFGGKFDFLFLIRELMRLGLKIDVIVPRGSMILYFEVSFRSKRITFRDSSALLPFSLKSLTQDFDVKTKKGDWDHSKTKGYSEGLSSYLKSDTIGLYEVISKFYNWPLIKKSGPAFTIASQAIRILRTFMNEPIFSLSKNTDIFCRKAYYGGRTEIFKPYCKPNRKLYEYDVNSLYPYVLQKHEFPVGNAKITFKLHREKLGIYHARVTTPDRIHVPVLGIIERNKYIFPVGTFQGYWTCRELLLAESKGYKIEIIEGRVFTGKAKPFKEFIDTLYKIRLDSPKNSVNSMLTKLIMNSSYGRFGLNLEKENIGFDLKEGVKEFREVKIKGKNIMLYKEPVSLTTFTHSAIAAFVTSYARIHMYNLISKIHPSKFYYMDTDSIFTTQKLESSKKLGELKLEDTHVDGTVFLLPKTYIALGGKLGKKIKMKGFDNKYIQHFELSDFRHALEGDLKRMKVNTEPKFATFKSALAQKKIVTMTKSSTKELRSVYDKRRIDKVNNDLDGFVSFPLRVEIRGDNV